MLPETSATNANAVTLMMPTEYAGKGINPDYFSVLCRRVDKRMPGRWPGTFGISG